MEGHMQCSLCGERFYSAAAYEFLLQGERCTCGGLLEAAVPVRSGPRSYEKLKTDKAGATPRS
jgi:hypothetical protein